MCGVIVVDADRSQSTGHGRGAYMHNHCLGYHHNLALFYQLLDSNLFTHRIICLHERSLYWNLWPPGLFSIILLSNLRFCNLLFSDLYTKKPKNILSLFIYLYQISLLQLTVKGLTTPLSRLVQVFDCLCRCWWFVRSSPTGLIPWFLTEGNTYLYYAASPFPLQGKNQRKLK
jgi:hypothetical protein